MTKSREPFAELVKKQFVQSFDFNELANLRREHLTVIY